jgi:hypothetical protein
MKLIYKKLEILGMIIVILSISWEIFIESETKRLETNYYLNNIERKLDDIWWHLANVHTLRMIKEKKEGEFPLVGDNYKNVVNRWKNAAGTPEYLEKQVSTITNIRFIIFMLGSILLLTSKYMELKIHLRQKHN